MSATAIVPSRGAWTDERVELLRKLWAEGLSNGEISKRLGGGISRGSVAGKISRMGLPKRDAAAAPAGRGSGIAAPTRDLTRVTKAPDKTRPHPAGSLDYLVSEDQPLPPEPTLDVPMWPKFWEEREFGECAFPITQPDGRIFSCCRDNGGRTQMPYCAEHLKIMRGKKKEYTDEQKAAFKARAARASITRRRNAA